MNNLKTNATAGAPTPNGRERSSANENALIENTQFVDCATPLIDVDLDARLDEMIAIADATGATLDAVVARLGRSPEDAFRFFVDTLASIVGGEV